MSETIRGAWIGAVGTIVGVLVTLVAQPVLTELLGPKREGVFSVEQTCISVANLDVAIASQVTSFPCQLRIAHIEGPAATKLSVSLTSQHPLSDITLERNDESVEPKLSKSQTALSVEIPSLRQGSVVDIRFVSKGEPRIDKNIIRESGSIVSDLPPKQPASWYNSMYGALAIVAALTVAAVAVFYSIYLRLILPVTGPISKKGLMWSATIVTFTFIPVLNLADAIMTLLLLAILHIVSGKKFL